MAVQNVKLLYVSNEVCCNNLLLLWFLKRKISLRCVPQGMQMPCSCGFTQNVKKLYARLPVENDLLADACL